MTARLDGSSWLFAGALAMLAALLGLIAGAEPLLAIAGALAIALFLLTVSSLVAGLVGFIVLSFLELLPSLGGPALSLAKIAGGVLALSWLAAVASGQYKRLFPSAHPFLTALLIGLLAWNGLSILWAEDVSRVLPSVVSFLLSFALFPIVFSAMRTKRDARLILFAFVGGATFTAIYGIIVQPDAVGLASSPAAAGGLDRLAGTIGDPNELASLLVVGVALSSALIFNPNLSRPLRTATVLAAGLMLLGVFLTLSRGGLVALTALIVTWVLVSGRHRLQALAGGIAVVAVALLFFLGFAPDEARDRITATDGGAGRTDIWTVGWRIVEAEPVTGVGAANFQVASIHYLVAPGVIEADTYLVDTPSVAHNTYLQVLTETGVPGLVLFLSIVAACIAAAVRAQRAFRLRGDREGELMATAMIVATGSILAAYFFLSEEHSKHLWLLLSLGPALLAVSGRVDGERSAAAGP